MADGTTLPEQYVDNRDRDVPTRRAKASRDKPERSISLERELPEVSAAIATVLGE